MRFPIDTSRLQSVVAVPVEPRRQFDDGKPRRAWAPLRGAKPELAS
jgi:hypothetical protein